MVSFYGIAVTHEIHFAALTLKRLSRDSPPGLPDHSYMFSRVYL
jgi:hypothetical protein